MDDLLKIRDVEDITYIPPGWAFDPMSIAEEYRILAGQCEFYFPEFDEFTEYWKKGDEPKLLVMARHDGRLTGLVSFSAFTLPTAIFFGPGRNFQIPMVQAGLFGGSVLGNFDERSALEILDRAFRHLRFDMLSLADLPGGNGLLEALTRSSGGRLRNVTTRRTARRLLILPESYDRFFASLKSTTAKAVRRDQRLFDSLAPTYNVITEPDDVADFVRAAAAITSMTQKVKRGAGGVTDTPATHEQLVSLARRGCLRAYLAQVENNPVACAWGDIANGVFYFRDTAFDPALGKYSPGRAVLLHVIADLIAAGARVLDFGIRDFAYKERLSNRTVQGATIQIARTSSPRGLLAVALHKGVDRLKEFIDQRLGRRY
jgi:hypothetical protein